MLWKWTLDLPNEVLQGILSKTSIKLLLRLRCTSSRLRLLTKKACEIREQNIRFSFNSPLERVYEPVSREKDLELYCIRNYTPFTFVILLNQAANKFIEEMRPFVDKNTFPSSLALDCEVRFPKHNSNTYRAKKILKLSKGIEILDAFGPKLSFLSIILEYDNPLRKCDFIRLFTNLKNLKGLCVSNAMFNNKDTSTDEDNLPPLKLQKLNSLKLICCNDKLSKVLLESCLETLLYLHVFTYSNVNDFFSSQCVLKLCKLQYLSIYSLTFGYSEGFCNFLQTLAPNLKGMRFSTANNIFDSKHTSVFRIALEVLNLNTLQIMGTQHYYDNFTNHLQIVKAGLKLKTLYIPYWFLSKFDELQAFVSQLLNLTRLVFVYKGESSTESTYLIPVNWISLAKQFSFAVQVKSIEIKYGRTRYCVHSGLADLDGQAYLKKHPM